MTTLHIRPSDKSDLANVMQVHVDAFGESQGHEVAQLARDLMADKTANPQLSLVAEVNGQIAGHVLLTHATITPNAHATSAQLLAPLGISSEFQQQGIGHRLVEESLSRSANNGVQLVFVLGHPSYYPRFGFRPAGEIGLHAPFPIEPENAPAWMVLELVSGVIGRVRGTVRCAASLNHPEHWVE